MRRGRKKYLRYLFPRCTPKHFWYLYFPTCLFAGERCFGEEGENVRNLMFGISSLIKYWQIFVFVWKRCFREERKNNFSSSDLVLTNVSINIVKRVFVAVKALFWGGTPKRLSSRFLLRKWNINIVHQSMPFISGLVTKCLMILPRLAFSLTLKMSRSGPSPKAPALSLQGAHVLSRGRVARHPKVGYLAFCTEIWSKIHANKMTLSRTKTAMRADSWENMVFCGR